MNNFNVKLVNGEYPVFIGKGYFEELPGLIKGNYDRILIITDEHLIQFYKVKITALKKNLLADLVVLPPGERTKSLKTVISILNLLTEKRFTRNSMIIALGGGVIGDLSGLAASLFMRGINIIHVPTTLLSSVDSSVGGKTGVNYKNIKNLVGTFYHPRCVLVDPFFLKTLPDDEFTSGMGEVVKCAFLSGGNFYKQVSTLNSVKKDDFESLCSIITNCLSYKASVIQKDERDTGIRQLLNFGHTFGHAYESASKFRIKHGIAVLMGISSSLFLSRRLNLISGNNLNDYLEILLPFLPAKMPKLDGNNIIHYISLDKKNRSGEVNFVLLKEPGLMLLNVRAGKKAIQSSIKETLELKRDINI